MTIAVDFDGTICHHDFPGLGDEIENAINVLRQLNKKGHKIIIFTMRSDEYLDDAVDFLKRKGVELYGLNHNPDQTTFTTSPKAYAHLYIDDAALGCPVKYSSKYKRNYVDWYRVESHLKHMKIL